MTGTQAKILEYWKKLTKRERIIATVTVLVVLSWLVYQFPYTLQARWVRSLTARVASSEREILDLTAQITDLRGRSAEIKAGGKASAARELVDQKGVVLFLQDVSGEARRLGVSLVSIHPSQEVDKDGYKEISMSLDLKARYRELAEYFRRLEGLSHVVNVRKIRVESCPDSSSVCSAQLEAVTYMAK
jgi:Tfp pilus assembly protein PilO